MSRCVQKIFLNIFKTKILRNSLDIDILYFFDDTYFQKTNTDKLFASINKLSESERAAFLNLIDELNKFKEYD